MDLKYIRDSFENNPAKVILNVFGLIISVFVLSNLFMQISNKIAIKIFGCAFALFLELFGQFALASGKDLWRRGKKILAVAVFLPYAGYGAGVMAATVIFSVSEINAVSDIAETREYQRQTIIDSITDYKASLHDLQIQRRNITNYAIYDRQWRYNRIDNRIEAIESNIAVLNDSLNEYNAELVNVSSEGLNALGKIFDKNNENAGDTIKVIMFSFIGLFLIVGLIMTSWDLPDKIEPDKQRISTQKIVKNNDYELICKFIDNLDKGAGVYRGDEGDNGMAQILGVRVWESKKIRNMLKQIPIKMRDGTTRYLLEGGQGGSSSIFTPEQMKHYVKIYLNLGGKQ
jgi:energy-coupling factor transporter transmembrane protein EcfT